MQLEIEMLLNTYLSRATAAIVKSKVDCRFKNSGLWTALSRMLTTTTT